MDSDEASVAGTQGGFSSTIRKKKQVGNIKPVPRSVSNNTQEPENDATQPSSFSIPQHGHITQIGVMINLPHMLYHIIHLMVINSGTG